VARDTSRELADQENPDQVAKATSGTNTENPDNKKHSDKVTLSCRSREPGCESLQQEARDKSRYLADQENRDQVALNHKWQSPDNKKHDTSRYLVEQGTTLQEVQ
jgi:hypothetical protein